MQRESDVNLEAKTERETLKDKARRLDISVDIMIRLIEQCRKHVVKVE